MNPKMNLRYIFSSVLKSHPDVMNDYDVVVEIGTPRKVILCTKGMDDKKEKEKAVFKLADEYEDTGLIYSMEARPDQLPERVLEEYGMFENKTLLFLLKEKGEL